MGSIKKELGIAVLVAGLVAVAITFVSVVSSNASKKVEIRLAHNQTAGSEIADSIAKFADFVSEDPSQNLDVKIYATGARNIYLKQDVVCDGPEVLKGKKIRTMVGRPAIRQRNRALTL